MAQTRAEGGPDSVMVSSEEGISTALKTEALIIMPPIKPLLSQPYLDKKMSAELQITPVLSLSCMLSRS